MLNRAETEQKQDKSRIETEQKQNGNETETKVKLLSTHTHTHTHPTKRRHFLDISVLCPVHSQQSAEVMLIHLVALQGE
jgi:hypothetical protein